MENLTVKDVIEKVDDKVLLERSLPKWREILINECQVYVFNEQFLAKRFDQINYKYCEKEEAKEVLVDNLYALLRYKYFNKSTEEVDEKIQKICSSFTVNLKTTLKKVTFDKFEKCDLVELLPDYCIAFRNGVYDFKNDKWLFKYDIKYIKILGNYIYNYDPKYIIQWCLNFDFEPLPINVMNTSIEDFIDMMKELTKEDRNYCFELLYNIAHDKNDNFDVERFKHLSQILGYTLLQSFSQYFVMLIGSGQNGKNSLFDGCFTNRVFPTPANNDMEEIETDKFITGSLQNKYHNIFLETSAKTYRESKMIKALTGSMYQTIQDKGINKYSGVINCKYIFAGNDREKIKFNDDTVGFIRRINMFEIYYHWDSKKSFLKAGDYYDTSFSNSLRELKNDISNTIAYIYFGIYGIKAATNNFEDNFTFTYNEWNRTFIDFDRELKDGIDNLRVDKLINYVLNNKYSENFKTILFDEGGNQFKNSKSLLQLGYKDFEGIVKLFEDEEAIHSYFMDHDIYICVRDLQKILNNLSSPTSFTQGLKKACNINNFEITYGNKPYVKVKIINDKVIILKNQKPTK